MKNQPYTLFDPELSRGYIYTNILTKSLYYTNISEQKFSLIDFIGTSAALLLGFWWIFKFLMDFFIPI